MSNVRVAVRSRDCREYDWPKYLLRCPVVGEYVAPVTPIEFRNWNMVVAKITKVIHCSGLTDHPEDTEYSYVILEVEIEEAEK